MPKLSDVKEIARSTFEDAASNLDNDLAASETPKQARMIMDNHDRALAIYLACLRKGLECADDSWTPLFAKAVEARAAIIAEREESEDIAERIRKLGALTDAVAKLVKAAT